MSSRPPGTGVRERIQDALYVIVYDKAYNVAVLFVLAAVLGLASLVIFTFSPSMGPTNVELLLLIASASILFYLALTHGTE